MAVIKMNFLSKALGMQTNLTVCLPSYSFADSMEGREVAYVQGMKFQCLYLMHGGSGDDSDYVNFTNIVRYADRNKLAVIMPGVHNSAYTDLPYGRYFTYVAEELPQLCEAFFPISGKREDTFVGGLSMGSHGAMKLAMLYPERYRAALMMSGASYRPGIPSIVKTKNGEFDWETDMRVPVGQELQDNLHDEAFLRGTVNDVYAAARRNIEEGKLLPKLIFRVGDSDHALYRTIRAEEDLRQWGYDTTLEIVPGMGHEWDLWDETLRLAADEWLPLRRTPIYPD
ncbi:alpha/beta hydrolase [Paenibacillus sp. 1P07SE]|uniref:alpha/beta hydrolase n=1 Tax=Paenibacillus sp. 1P07SE TaxID=3132209 RepID=UPI0039A6E5A4